MSLNERLRKILDKRSVEDCGCALCENRKAHPFSCSLCGYEGRPATMGCTCYDDFCQGGGAGCFHGAIVCPVCDDGEGDVDPWDMIKRLRAEVARL